MGLNACVTRYAGFPGSLPDSQGSACAPPWAKLRRPLRGLITGQGTISETESRPDSILNSRMENKKTRDAKDKTEAPRVPGISERQ